MSVYTYKVLPASGPAHSKSWSQPALSSHAESLLCLTRPHSQALYNRFQDSQSLPIARDQMNKTVVSFAQGSTWYRMVCLPNSPVAVVKNIYSPSGACDLLSVFWVGPAKMSHVKVFSDHSKTVQVFALHPRQLFRQCVLCSGDVILRRVVNTREDEHVTLTGGIEWAAEYE